MREYIDEMHMHKLYEKFVLEYFRKEHPKLHANADMIAWQLGTDFNLYLPTMQTDITLHYQGNTLIIDTKYYANGTPLATNSQYGNQTLHSGNIYQIFTYIKNAERKFGGKVAGCLLYAKNKNVKDLDLPYNICGNDIMVKTIDLNKDFQGIRKQLDILANYLYEMKR
jgi:5-methylcytosine-specific restriction enzyme subunit McrC